VHFCPPIVGNIRVPDGCGGRNSSFFTRHRLWYSPFKPFSPEGGNICVPAGCGGRNSAFFTRHRLWYSPLQAISPERRKYLCACRVWRTKFRLFHPAPLLVRPLQAISPGRRKYLCARRVWRTILCLSHPAPPLVRPPFKPFPPEGGNICVPAGCGGRNFAFFTRHRHPAFRNPLLRSSKSSVTAFFIASRNRKCYDTVMIDQLKAGAHNVPLQSERTGCHIRQSCIRGFAECEVFISRGFSGIYR